MEEEVEGRTSSAVEVVAPPLSPLRCRRRIRLLRPHRSLRRILTRCRLRLRRRGIRLRARLEGLRQL